VRRLAARTREPLGKTGRFSRSHIERFHPAHVKLQLRGAALGAPRGLCQTAASGALTGTELMASDTRCRSVVAIPAYNEAATIRAVVDRVRADLPECDVLVVNDGSHDDTAGVLCGSGAVVADHLCNLGYGRAIQTAVLYATRGGYDRLITLDADGQHDPAQVRPLLAEFDSGRWDILIGSRYVATQSYDGVPAGRRVGMRLFSSLVRLTAGRRIYDTTSGLKIIARRTFAPLTNWQFIDFHAEALVYLMRLGFRIGEFPITVANRRHGQSMYSTLSHVKYPLKTMLMLVLGLAQANLTRKRAS
jgi:glycosyltransferase involved in cell wall biosynthesis